jgi:hypothetical protein
VTEDGKSTIAERSPNYLTVPIRHTARRNHFRTRTT